MKIEYKYIVALIYAIALFLDRLDLTIVNVTLPTLAKIFHVPLTATDWVSMAFLLALAISIPISGWLGERFGFKKIYLLSMILFGTGSTVCAFAPNMTILVMARFLHGIGGGMLIPIGMTILYRIFDKSDYASITSFTFLPSLIAPAIAPFLGGLLLDIWNWQVVFLFSAPICLILVFITAFYLEEQEQPINKKLDILGFILFSSILLAIFYGLALIGKANVFYQILMIVILLPFLIYLFTQQERSTLTPLFDLHYFTNGNFIKANLLQLCFQICHFGAIFLIGMYLQAGIGFSASMAGFIMGMQAIGAISISRYSVRLFNLYGAKLPIYLGFLGIAILSPCILFVNNPKLISLGMMIFFIRGLFSGLCGTPIQTISLIDFPKNEIVAVNTIFNAARQISISLGVAISSGIMAFGMRFANIETTHPINSTNVFAVFSPGFFIIPLVALIGITITHRLKEFY